MEYHDLEKMTVVQLREEAKKFPELKGLTGMKKEELMHILVEKLGLQVPEKKDVRAHAGRLDKPALKKKLAELRAARSAAQAVGDHKKTNVLRRRIHLIKRRTRAD